MFYPITGLTLTGATSFYLQKSSNYEVLDYLNFEIFVIFQEGLKKKTKNLYAGRIYLKVNLQGSGCQFLSRNTSNKVSHMERKKANYQQTNKQTKTLSGWNRRIQSHFGIWKQESQYHLCVSVHSINSEQCFSRWRSQYQTPKSEYTQHTECSTTY